jgi:hypothetical protein
MKIFSIASLFAIVLFMASCGKHVLDYGEVEKLSGDEAALKINYVSAYPNNPSVFFKINDQRISNLLTWRTPYPGGGYNTGGDSQPNFLLVKPGAVKLSVCLPYKVDTGKDSLVLYSTTINLTGGGKFVVHITDTAALTKTVVTEETFLKTDSALTAYRFINLMPNVSSIDLYYGTSATDHALDTLLAGNVNYLKMTDQFRVRSGQSKTWKIRPAGAAKTTATILASYTSASTFLSQRVYNIFACGYDGKTTTAQKPYVSWLQVR